MKDLRVGWCLDDSTYIPVGRAGIPGSHGNFRFSESFSHAIKISPGLSRSFHRCRAELYSLRNISTSTSITCPESAGALNHPIPPKRKSCIARPIGRNGAQNPAGTKRIECPAHRRGNPGDVGSQGIPGLCETELGHRGMGGSPTDIRRNVYFEQRQSCQFNFIVLSFEGAVLRAEVILLTHDFLV